MCGLAAPADPVAFLNQIAVIKLNGALGTTMGCTFPKSLIVCQNGQIFFDLTLQQIRTVNTTYGVNVPLILMQSFYTEDLMKPSLADTKGVRVLTYNQNKFPRILEDTLEPVSQSPNGPLSEWNQSGHGDVFHCLRDSGLFDQRLAEGKRFIFISNIDNLGATIDLKVLNKLVAKDRAFIAETVPKTPDGWKGVMPILYKGGVKLLEVAQVPAGHLDDFKNVAIFDIFDIFDIFNANNKWVSLPKLKAALDSDTLVLDVIKNRKVLNGRSVIQLEAAAGSAIQSFPDSISVRMPRKRFLPVKACSDLFMMRSDLYARGPGADFEVSPAKGTGELPHFVLGPLYMKVQDLEARFPVPPSLLKLNSLEIVGDVTFGAGIVLEGSVAFKAPDGEKLVVPDWKVYKDVVVTAAVDL
jgi:UTP--glucose-1-phosphate uridylyltransferase